MPNPIDILIEQLASARSDESAGFIHGMRLEHAHSSALIAGALITLHAYEHASACMKTASFVLKNPDTSGYYPAFERYGRDIGAALDYIGSLQASDAFIASLESSDDFERAAD